MRKGFTLIELMIVIAIIAIIAAIAIPNLLESRITSNESAAATSLKSGLHPAQAQFQGGNYCDDAPGAIYGTASNGGAGLPGSTAKTLGNGIGDFAGTFVQMAGADADLAQVGTVTLTLMPTTWAPSAAVDGLPAVVGGGAYAAPLANGAGGLGPNINNYLFNMVAANENGFSAMATPADGVDSIGRRRFAINASGTVYSSGAAATNSQILPTGALSPFGGTAGTPGTIPFNTPTGVTPTNSPTPWAVHKK